MSEESNRRPLPVGLDQGEGPPLVLIPGYGTRPDTYRSTASLLAERCRVILVDIYAVRCRWRYENVLESFTATLDHLGLDRASFLGHSFGSGIELGFAVRHPERVVELVFCDTLALSSQFALALECVGRPVRVMGMATPKAAVDFIRSWVTYPRQMADAAWWGFTSGRSDDVHLVADAGIPAHVLWAKRDSLLRRRDGEEFARQLNASFDVCRAPGYVDHDWMYRHPQLFVDHLDRLGLSVLGSAPIAHEDVR
jgi:pimeloyl-ACP methyl ester carboxylesterase